MARQSSVNLRVRVVCDTCTIPALSRRAYVSSRRLKPKTGNQKLGVLGAQSA